MCEMTSRLPSSAILGKLYANEVKDFGGEVDDLHYLECQELLVVGLTYWIVHSSTW